MKLIKCEITGFGRYRGEQVTFFTGNQLLYGPNEIGKSTLYQFIQTMLFGFPARRGRQRDYTPKDGTAFGGKLWLEAEGIGEVCIERYKLVDRGRAKVTIGETVGDEELLKQVLRGLTPQLFSDVFTFQQEQLSQLEHLQENELQEALISLGITGSRQLMAAGQRYQTENQKRYKPRGTRLPINEQLVRWQQLSRQIREKEALEATVQERFARQSQAAKQLQTVRRQLKKQQEEQLILKDRQLHWSQYEEWQTLEQLTKVQDTPELSASQQRQLQEIYQENQSLTQQLANVDQEYHRAKQAETVTPQYEFYLQHEQIIKELLKRQVEGVRLTDSFHQDLARQQQLLEQIEKLESRYGWQLDLPEQLDLKAADELINTIRKQAEDLRNVKMQQEWLAAQPVTTLTFASERTGEAGSKENRRSNQKRVSDYSLAFSILPALAFLLAGIFIFPNHKAIFGVAAIVCGVAGSWYFYHRKQQKALHQVLGKPTTAAENEAVATDLTQEDQQVQRQEELAALSQQMQQLSESLQQLATRLAKLLATAATAPILADSYSYQQDYLRYHQYLTELEQVTSQLQKQDQAYGDLTAEFDFAAAWLPLQELDLVQRFEFLQQLDQKLTRQKQLHGQQQTTLLAEQRQQLTLQQQALEKKAEPLLQATATDSLSAIPQRLQAVQQMQGQQQRLEELQNVLAPLFPQPILHQELRDHSETNQQTGRRLQEEETALLEELQRQNVQLEVLQKDGTLDELRQKQAELETELYEELVQWGGRKTAQAALTDLATDLSQQQLPQLLEAAGNYLEILTEGRYRQLSFFEGQLVLRENSTGQEATIFELSTGTKDQLIMAVRFGYLQLQSSRKLSPVIIDDGWLHYDSRRKRQLAQLFARFGENYQVICLSSDREMVSYYQELSQPVLQLGKTEK
ncbi:ATP-binding protein [Candidatus Enterococcus leclercqii]|uniref:ATP-binding protein n=1 Tax=Candidatus Enterococcus leclercqii TaxID=1857218 RepID=UPI00137AD782|nr:AAA family ATPase [Enterococcus sp. CU9D]KAF1293900.1 hypothetical protein BAU14_11670 [Enterococcus sp. CU9D]